MRQSTKSPREKIVNDVKRATTAGSASVIPPETKGMRK